MRTTTAHKFAVNTVAALILLAAAFVAVLIARTGATHNASADTPATSPVTSSAVVSHNVKTVHFDNSVGAVQIGGTTAGSGGAVVGPAPAPMLGK